MASVPLASIQDEWSEFVDFKSTDGRRSVNRRDAAKCELDDGSRADQSPTKPDKKERNSNSQDHCDKLGKSKGEDKQPNKQLNCAASFVGHSTSPNGSPLNRHLNPQLNSHLNSNDQTDEEEEEFRAFQQQFDQIKQQADDGPTKIKVESLEELVKTFDEKIVHCFLNYEEPVESLAPVQVLNPEELIGECEMWWKLTGNLNQILPVDWRSTYAMRLLLPYLIGGEKQMDCAVRPSSSLLRDHNKFDIDFAYLDCADQLDGDPLDHLDGNLDSNVHHLDSHIDDDQFALSSYGYDYSTCNLQTDEPHTANRFSSYLNQFESEYEEQLARDLDFHSLILCSTGDLAESNDHKNDSLLFTAEEVLKELDIILAEGDADFPEDYDHTLDQTLEQALDGNTTLNSVAAPNAELTTLRRTPDDRAIDSASNSNFYTNYLNETDELDGDFAKETLQQQQNIATSSNLARLKAVSLLKPYSQTNSIGTSFSSNSLDEVLSFGQSLSRSQTSSSQISSGVEGGSSYYPLPGKSQSEIENEKQLFERQLRTLNVTQLNEIYLDLERMIQNHSEILISELALKDELEYEKELKNQFISLLICIQNKRRKQNLIKKSNPKATNENVGSKYLTTVIPYNRSLGAPDTRTLQVLIKILKAVNEDSPTVPTLLTDFILRVVCPTT